MTEHRKYHPERIGDLEVAVSEADDVKGGRPMDDEVEFIGDSEQPNPSGPGENTGGGFISAIADAGFKRAPR